MKRKICLLTAAILLMSLLLTQPMEVLATDGPSTVISGGEGVTFAIKKDGSLWGYGSVGGGKLGVESEEAVLTPVKIMEDVRSVVTSDRTTFAIKRDGSLWAWGENFGKFGNGTTKYSLTPVKVMEGVKMVASSSEYTLIIKTDGSLWGSGSIPGEIPGFNGNNMNDFNQLMVGEQFKFISANSYFAMVIKENDELWGWGNNSYAALGTGNTEGVKNPVKIMENVAFVSTDSFSSMIVTKDSILYMCGSGYNGLFYDGKTVVNAINGDGLVKTPIKIMDNVLYADSEGNRWFVVKRDNTLWGWGSDGQFSLFKRYTDTEMIPSKLASQVAYISAGSRHIVVLKTNQTLWTAGQNASGGIAGHPTAYENYDFQQDMTDIMDAPEPWAQQEVDAAIINGLVPGELQSDYKKPISRKEFAKLVINMIEKKTGQTYSDYIESKGLKISESSPFTDVDDIYVTAAFSLSIVSGVGNNKYDPDKTINRQEAAKMLTATATALGYDTEAALPSFNDVAKIDNWAKPYIGYMVEIGVMKGVSGNNFDPKGTYVRQMAFVTMNRIYNNLQ